MYTTINISSKEARLLSLKNKGAPYWSSASLQPGWIKEGHILNPKEVGAIIVSLLDSARIPRSDVVISITGLPFTYRTLELPIMKQSLVRDSIKHIMIKEMSMPNQQMCLSWAAIDNSSDEVKYFVLGVDQQIVDAVARTMGEAKIKNWAMDLKSLALARAASQDNALIVSVEPGCYDIVLVNNGNISTMHTVTFDETKINTLEQSKQLIVEISKAISYDARTHGQYLISRDTPLLLTGELSLAKGVGNLIETDLGYPVKPLTPQVSFESDLPVHLYAANMGLLVKYENDSGLVSRDGNLYNDIDLDILSGRYLKARKPLPFMSAVVPFILIFALGLVPPVQQAISEYDAESLRLYNDLGTVNQQIREARLLNSRASQIRGQITDVYAQLEASRKAKQALFGNQGEFAGDLVKVVNALPAQSFFTSLDLSPQEIKIKGYADNAFQVVEYTAILKQKGLPSNIRISEIKDVSGGQGVLNRVTFEVIIVR